MSDDDSRDAYGDIDERTAPEGGSGRDTTAGDGLPGYPVDGHPDWRAGVFGSGNGVLGMVRVSDLVARPGNGRAPPGGPREPRLMKVSDPVLDWEQNSWRWNDADAIAYDLDRKQRQLAEAQNLATASQLVGKGQGALAGARAASGIGVMSTLPATATAAGVGLYMKHLEAPRIRSEITVLQNRLDQLRGRSAT